MNPQARWKSAGLAAVLAAQLLAIASCSSAGSDASPEKVASDLKNKDLQQNQRMQAMEEMWRAGKDDPARIASTREGLKEIIWKGGAPVQLRQRALALLLSDESADGLADTRNMLRLRLPTEGAWPMVVDISNAVTTRSADPAWRELTAALVRSYARKVPIPPDPDRPEREALLALYPGQDLNKTVYEVFVRPENNGAPKRPDDFAEKARQAAWDLLGRLDPDGSARTHMIAQETREEPVLKDLARAARELGVTPITGSELAWLRDILSTRDAKNAAWWEQTTAALRSLNDDQRRGLSMRHLEPIRFASTQRQAWLSASSDSLYSELSSRLQGRKVWLKPEDSTASTSWGGAGGARARETLADWRDRLSFGDLLSILLIDDALHQPGMNAEFFKQVRDDRADSSTEYGGALFARDQPPTTTTTNTDQSGTFVVRLFPPRPAQRVNDRTFVASEEMFRQSGRSIAHYHFHVQTDNNAEYAGPGRGDLEYAQTHGRNCVVLTSVRSGILNADFYIRDNLMIDLGEVREN
jgi:hypothetical protein